jgi:ribosomal protein L35
MSINDSINFTREAFLHPINLGFLFISALSAFFLNDVGYMAEFIFTMAIGTELVLLGTVPKIEAFKRHILNRTVKEKPRKLKDKELFYNLETRSQKRFLILKNVSEKIQENFRKFPYTSKGLTSSIEIKIEELLSNYISMLDSYGRYETYIRSTKEQDLLSEIEELNKELETIESEKLRQIKKRRHVIIGKRHAKLLIARERLQICESQLETIEDAMRYIYEQSITMDNPEQIGFQLDNLVNDVEEMVTIVEDLEDEMLPGYNMLQQLDEIDSEIQQNSAQRLNQTS